MKTVFTYGCELTKRNVTVKDLRAGKGRKKFTQVTAINQEEAEAAVAAGVDTLSCGLADYDAVRAGAPNAFIVTALSSTDLPTQDDILRAAMSVMERGSDALYVFRALSHIEVLANEGIPVMSHLGMNPRLSTWNGGLNGVGKTAYDALALLGKFRDLENAGAFGVEVELIADRTLAEISKHTNLVTFSIGAGSAGDVIFLYTNDICGETEKLPRHAKAYGNLRALQLQMQQERIAALSAFQADVLAGNFPATEHNVQITDDELAKFTDHLSKKASPVKGKA